MNSPLSTLLALVFALAVTSCHNTYDEEPPVNQGYKTTIREPNAEELTDEDKALIQSQQAEYNKNRKNT